MLTIALPKGRLYEESIEILKNKHIIDSSFHSESSELMRIDHAKKFKILQVRSQDVLTYVEEKAADLGILGEDVIRENNPQDLFIPLDLKIGKCRLSIASTEEFTLENKERKIRVATKYPNLTKDYFFKKGYHCEIIKLYGSMELAPKCGLADCIVDLVSTGKTLKENGLLEKEILFESSAKLIVNQSSFYTQKAECLDLIYRLN